MDKQLEGAQQALAAAKAFRDEHVSPDGDTLPADKLAEYRKMLDTAEALSDQFRANKQARELDEKLGQFNAGRRPGTGSERSRFAGKPAGRTH